MPHRNRAPRCRRAECAAAAPRGPRRALARGRNLGDLRGRLTRSRPRRLASPTRLSRGRQTHDERQPTRPRADPSAHHSHRRHVLVLHGRRADGAAAAEAVPQPSQFLLARRRRARPRPRRPRPSQPPPGRGRGGRGGPPPPQPAARLLCHFLPKFDNQAEGRRLCDDPIPEARCLSVSKKHSGHLVMCPPFYSKNGSANPYSRMGELLLRAHFAAVWPDEPSRFDAWWAHAHAHGLCYSFECVVPRILGDHGATPAAAYMVLTCVSHTGRGGAFLSPSEVLLLGAAWRLPLNEAWFVPWGRAAAVEGALHAARWTLADADVDALLDGAGPLQRFLRHGDTQGEVLEGFVLMALDADADALAPLVAAYDAAVAPHRAAALARALELGAACRACDATIQATLDAPSAREPRGSAGRRSRRGSSRAGDDAPLPRAFRTLRALYSHRVALKANTYDGHVQLQVDVGDDQISSAGAHRRARRRRPTALVVQYDGFELLPLAAALASAAMTPPRRRATCACACSQSRSSSVSTTCSAPWGAQPPRAVARPRRRRVRPADRGLLPQLVDPRRPPPAPRPHLCGLGPPRRRPRRRPAHRPQGRQVPRDPEPGSRVAAGSAVDGGGRRGRWCRHRRGGGAHRAVGGGGRQPNGRVARRSRARAVRGRHDARPVGAVAGGGGGHLRRVHPAAGAACGPRRRAGAGTCAAAAAAAGGVHAVSGAGARQAGQDEGRVRAARAEVSDDRRPRVDRLRCRRVARCRRRRRTPTARRAGRGGGGGAAAAAARAAHRRRCARAAARRRQDVALWRAFRRWLGGRVVRRRARAAAISTTRSPRCSRSTSAWATTRTCRTPTGCAS